MTADVARYRSRTKQWLATLLVTLPMVIIGSLEYLVEHTLDELEMLYPYYTADFERSTAVIILGGVIGAIIGAISADMDGRRAALFGTIISIICGITGMLQSSIIRSYISLLVAGISAGIAYTVVPLYVSEIADDEIRGRLLMLPLVGPYIGHLTHINVLLDSFYIIQIVFPILFLGTFYQFPETPYHLALNKKYELATKSVSFFRGIDEVAAKEDVDEIIATIEADGARPGAWNKIRDLFTGKGRKPLMIITFLVIVQCSAFFFYLPVSFGNIVYRMAQYEISIHGEMRVCVMLIVWTVFLTFTVDHFGRKFNFLHSALVGLVMIISEMTIFEGEVIPYYVTILCQLAILTVPFVLIGELFPTNVKSVASGMLTIFLLLFRFFVECLFRECETIKLYIIIALYAFAFVIVLAFLPETKKMSLAKIQSVLAQTE